MPAGGCATLPMGEVSVIPHAWTMRTPSSFSKASISDRGTADPPQGTIRSDERSSPWARTCWSSPFQIVGTAPARVGRSASMSRASGSGCRKRSGMIRSAPDMIAA